MRREKEKEVEESGITLEQESENWERKGMVQGYRINTPRWLVGMESNPPYVGLKALPGYVSEREELGKGQVDS